MTAHRIPILVSASLLLGLTAQAVAANPASARATQRSSVSHRALDAHRRESRWHLRLMNANGRRFASANRSIHRHFPWAAPMSDRMLGGTQLIHAEMESADLGFLGFHEWFAGG